MKLIVNPHKIQLMQEEAVNEKEINVSECEFEFADEITNDYVKEAYFTLGNDTYKKIIVNNKCAFPQEVLIKPATIELGVVAYLVEDDEEIVRYNPTPVYFKTDLGSLKQAQNSEEPTPSEMEQYEQALQDGLSEVNDKLDAMDTALSEVANLDIDAEKVGTTTTISITNKSGTTKTVQVQDGINGTNGRDGVDGKDGKDGVDGTNGRDGTDGTNGVDGYSPSASVSKSGSTATITITDKNGTTTATVSDGTNGTNGQDGQDGVGVPSGGTTGQVLAKTDGTDYNTQWVNPPSTIKTLTTYENYAVASMDEGLYITTGTNVSLNSEKISAPYSNSFIIVVKNNMYGRLAIVFNSRDLTNNNTDDIYVVKVFKGNNSSSIINVDLSKLADKNYVDTAIANAITTTLGGNY